MKGEELLPRDFISSADVRQDILAPRQGTTDDQIPEEFDGEGLLDNHPFFEGIDTHLLKTCAMLKASTIKEKRRKLQHIGRVFESLQQQNPLFTTDPGKLTETEVTAFINWMRENRIQPETQRKYLQMLRDYCLFCDNRVF